MNNRLILNWLGANGPTAREKLAVKAGLSMATIQHILSGHSNTKIETLQRLAKAIGVSARDLLSDPEDPNTKEAS